MPNINLTELKDKLTGQHEGDEKQLEVIFADSPRLIVEAPAGYGKTTTMISRIAYLFASGGIPNPKCILGLTFSVNAALKVKREVSEKLPTLIGTKNNPSIINDKVTVTNYHGFCKSILKKYGYLIADTLKKDVNLFRAIGDNEVGKHQEFSLSAAEVQLLEKCETTIKNSTMPDEGDIREYNDLVIHKLLPLEYITHNAVILFALDIFSRFPEVKKFYQSYYPLIVVDEFQDTNCIAWELLKSIISSDTQLLFLGDHLQRIYGFIGALPNIMTVAAEEYNMTQVVLTKNYRFRNNYEMMKLDANVRANATMIFEPQIAEANIAQVPAFWGNTQQEEAQQVVAKTKDLISQNEDCKIAILFRGRNKNAEVMESELGNCGIPYFYGMFTDEDNDYIEFHKKCQEIFIRKFGKSKNITKKSLSSFSEIVKEAYSVTSGKTIDSLFHLLDALVEKVSIDYATLLPEDKYSLLLDIFENRQLKQAMEYVDSQIILSTVHGAKGLEWDYVFIADLERWVFPGYYVCSNCPQKFAQSSDCKCHLPSSIPDSFTDVILDELSVFYVGITRARKQVFVSASAKRLDAFDSEKASIFSCMASINGIKLVNAKF